jgi:hypothetical protein
VHHNRASSRQQKAKVPSKYMAMTHCTDAWITNYQLESSTKRSTHPPPARMLEVVVATDRKMNHNGYHDNNAYWAANDDDDHDDDDQDGLVLDNPIEIEAEDNEPREGFASNNLLVMDNAMMMIMIAEEKERATADPPGTIQEKAMDEDEKNGEAKDGDSDNVNDDHGVTPHVPHRRGGRIAPPPPPPRRAHHAGEIIRTWLHNDGTASAARLRRPTPHSPKFPLPEQHRQQRPLFAGDGIRAWLAMD